MIITANTTAWQSVTVAANQTKYVQNKGNFPIKIAENDTAPAIDSTDHFFVRGGGNVILRGDSTFWILASRANVQVFIEDN